MNLDHLKDFEDELFLNLKKLNVDDPSGCLKYIVRMIKTYKNYDNLETIFREKLEFLLAKKTDEVIDIICNFFNIKRTYGFSIDKNVKDKKFSKNNDEVIKDARSLLDEACRRHYLQSRRNHGVKINNKNGINRNSRSSSKLKWKDLAKSMQSSKMSRKCRMPCSTFMDKGYCMNGDTCNFSHGKAVLVKPRVVHLNSVYNTNTIAMDCKTFILPKQNNYYSDNIDNKRKNNNYYNVNNIINEKQSNHSEDDRNNRAISVSSNDSLSSSIIMTSSPPIIYEPPSILDSPLWYKELGLVIEDSPSEYSSTSSSNGDRCRNNDHCRASTSRHDVSHEKRRLIRRYNKNNCLLVSNIPPELNRIGVINRHFRKFGILRNIECKFKNNSRRALVEFHLMEDMLEANRSTDAVMSNRFIKTQIYRKNKSSRKEKNNKNELKERKKCKSSKVKRSNTSFEEESGKLKNKESDKRKSRESKRNRYRNGSLESGEFVSHSREGSISRSQSSTHGHHLRYSNNDNICELPTVIVNEPMIDLVGTSFVKTEKRQELQSHKEKDTQVMEVDEKTTNESIIVQKNMPLMTSVDEDVRKNIHKDVHKIIHEDVHKDIREDVDDLKLERALNDSDVESMDTDDPFVNTQRKITMDQRRNRLRNETLKNNYSAKMQRIESSMNHYKCVLEALIAQFKSSDKVKKGKLVPEIKENHALFMQLKERRGKLLLIKQMNPNRIIDPVEGAITQLQSTISTKLSVTTDHTDQDDSSKRIIFLQVPIDVVLYPDQIQDELGGGLVVDNVEILECKDDTILYIITMHSNNDASQALNILRSHEIDGWTMSMDHPHFDTLIVNTK